ncbi:zinc-dependent metalloprotease [Aureispira]|nr:zinc-dependent metalloprotease [Aureispira sp.]
MVRCLFYFIGTMLFFLTQTIVTHAQLIHNHSFCGVGVEEGQIIKNRMLDNRRHLDELLGVFESSRGNDSTVYVPIQFHIVNKSDGSGGESIKDILANLCRLNADYLHLNIEFYLAGPVRFINQDFLYTNSFDNGMANFFMGLYKVDGVVNVFVGNQIVNSQSGGTTLGYFTSGLDIIYAIRGSVHGNATTLTHELGHFFSLPHTFFGWENSNYGSVMAGTNGRTPTFTLSGTAVENMYRAGGKENCQIAADGFCDTEPNYLFGFFGGSYNNGCDYAATAHDPNGWLFRPESIAASPDRFKFGEDSPSLTELLLRNNSSKDKLYAKTLVVVETEYTLGANTVTMWQDTIGDSDTTDFYCAANNADDIITAATPGALDVQYGFINMGGHYLDVNISAPTASSLSFTAAPAKYTITGSSHDVEMDSLRVTNTSAIDTVPSTTAIIITDVFTDGSTQISTADRTFQLPDSLAPGATHTFSAVDLLANSTSLPSLAGVSFNVNTYAPYRDTTGTTSENVMSYYSDACATQFSQEQGDAIKADIVSRGFATLYPAPANITITDTVTVNNPIDGAVAPQPLIHFRWNPVNGATIYHVHIYEINFLGIPLPNGVKYDYMVTDTEVWQTVEPNKSYEWVVYPINATSFCDLGIGSSKANFDVYDWAVGFDNLNKAVSSTRIYPNPSTKINDVIIEIKTIAELDAHIFVYNSIGKAVMPTQTLALAKGDNIQTLNTTSLSPGLYIINIKTKDSAVSHKLIINQHH